jgi:hypothetical protein
MCKISDFDRNFRFCLDLACVCNAKIFHVSTENSGIVRVKVPKRLIPRVFDPK